MRETSERSQAISHVRAKSPSPHILTFDVVANIALAIGIYFDLEFLRGLKSPLEDQSYRLRMGMVSSDQQSVTYGAIPEMATLSSTSRVSDARTRRGVNVPGA